VWWVGINKIDDTMPLMNIAPQIRFIITSSKAKLTQSDIEYVVDYISTYITDDVAVDDTIATISRHGLIPLVYHTLRDLSADIDIPSTLLSKLQARYKLIAQKNILLSAELMRLSKILQSNHINAIPFKGPVLAKLAYGDITLRVFGDLDIFIKRDDFDKFAQILIDSGYTPHYPIEEYQNAKKTLFELNNDVPFYNRSKRINIELHWDFFRKLNISTSVFNPWDNLQTVQMNHQNIQTLDHNTHLLYHSLHGSKHIWERIMWIADIDRFVRRLGSELDWSYILSTAKSLGTVKMFLFGIALAHRYYDTPLPTKILAQIDRVDLDYAIDFVEGEYNSFKSTPENSLVKLKIVLSLKDTFWNQAKTLLEFVFKPGINERRMIVLDDNLFGLYWVIRPFGMVYRFVKCKILKICP
jgi:hypothetical protein